jgi:SAM-dependent methyltransferase
VEQANRWTVPVSPEEIAAARRGDLRVLLTPKTPLPMSWVKALWNKEVLLLAGGGGQQSGLLAAFGARVTVADLSELQLGKDREIAEREGLAIRTVHTPAHDLSAFRAGSFDAIVNPCSSCFFPELGPVWAECARVLKTGGELMTGIINPVAYAFDREKANRGEFHMIYSLPYADHLSMSEADKARFLRPEEPLEFSHTLTEQIGGLIDRGFVVTGFFEDYWDSDEPINEYLPQFINFRAEKR